MTKHVVVIDAPLVGDGLGLVRAVKRLGLSLTFVTHDLDKFQQAYGQENIIGLLGDNEILLVKDSANAAEVTEAVLQLQARYPIDAVMTNTDKYVEASAAAAAALGLPHISTAAVNNARNKDLTRSLCQAQGVRLPAFQIIETLEEAKAFADKVGFPVVLKSSRGGGSEQVKLCESQEDLVRQYDYIGRKAQSVQGKIIIEEYVAGPVFSVEVMMHRGEAFMLGVSNRILSPFPNFAELCISFPVDLREDTRKTLYDAARQVLAALNVEQGACHIEMIMGEKGPYLVEINPRIGGGTISRMISKAYGVEIYEVLVRSALGERPQLQEKTLAAGCQYLFYANQKGRLKAINGTAMAQQFPGVVDVGVDVKVGDAVGPAVDWRGQAGWIFATGSDACVAQSNALAAANAIMLEVE